MRSRRNRTNCASAAPRPGGPEAIRHVEGREYSHRFDPLDELATMRFEILPLFLVKAFVLLVHEHLAPVFDQHVARRLRLVPKERTAEVRPAVTIHQCPFAVRAVESFEFLLAALTHVELPEDRDHIGAIILDGVSMVARRPHAAL